MFKVSLDKLNKICIYIMISIVMLDPSNKIFNLKFPVFFISVLISLGLIFSGKKIKINQIVLVFFYFIIPNLYSILVLYLSKKEFDIGYLKTYLFGSFFGLFIFNLNQLSRDELLKIFFRILKVYSIIYLLLIINFNFSIIKINKEIYEFSIAKENFMIGINYLYNYKVYNIFYKTSPILVIYYSYLLYYKKKWSLVIFFILFMSGTAANFLSTILITLFYMMFRIMNNKTLKIRISLFLFLSFVFIFIFKKIIFSDLDTGNRIKYGHLISYIEFWADNIKGFILGSGIGSGFYTSGRDHVAFNTELTYFEMIRLYGVIGFIPMFTFLCFPLLKIIRNNKFEWLFISYWAYLMIGGTNPLILGSTGTMVIILVYALINTRIP